MKKIYYMFLSLTLLTVGFFLLPKKPQTSFGVYDEKIDKKARKEKYNQKYEELSWIKNAEQEEVLYSTMQFLEGLVEGSYLDYLQLSFGLGKNRRFDYQTFCDLHKQIEHYIEVSIFSKEEMLDILFYSFILGEIEKTKVYKERAWVYEASLAKIILMHDQILPTMKYFSKEKKKFLCLMLEGLQFEGFLSNYRENIAYNIDEKFSALTENRDYFDLSFLMFVCRLAGKYGYSQRDGFSISAGYYNYLQQFKEDLLTHLVPSC